MTNAEQAARVIRMLLQHGDVSTAFRILIVYNDNLAAAAAGEETLNLVWPSPEPTGYPAWDAAIAGITEYRLNQVPMPSPEWTHLPRSAVPTVIAGRSSTGPIDPQEVPRELLKRNVLIESTTLAGAQRQPAISADLPMINSTEGLGMTSNPRELELGIYNDALRLSSSELVTQLREHLGIRLVMYLGGSRPGRIVDRWASGVIEPSPAIIERLRLAYRVARFLEQHDGRELMQAWFQGLNPQLNNRSPATALRGGKPETVGPEILAAARTHLAV